MAIDVSRHVRLLSYYVRAISDGLEDLKAQQEGIPLYYNLDFSLLCPVLFNKTPVGSKDFLMKSKDGMSTILSKGLDEGHFNIVMSGATLLEFYDQLNHLLAGYHARVSGVVQKYKEINPSDLRDLIVSSDHIRNELAIITARGVDGEIRQPINRLLGYLDKGTVRGIGDVVDAESLRGKSNVEQFNSFFEQQRARRLKQEEHRGVEDSLFHYRIDAANNCLTLAAAELEAVRTPFVTPSPLNIRQCTVDGNSFGRVEKTPLLLLNLQREKLKNTIPNETEFLEYTMREALELEAALRHFGRIEEIPNYTQLRLARFYSGPAGILSESGGVSERELENEHIEEMVERLSSEAGVRDLVEEAKEDIRDGARLIEMSAANFDVEYLDQFDFDNDPVVNRIRENLGVKL